MSGRVGWSAAAPPVPLTRLIGREREVAGLVRLIVEHRLVTVTGPGGCGKTRLAIAVATTAQALPPEGVCWVELAPSADPALVPQAVAAALGVRERPGAGLTATLVQLLAGAELLLVLDNCEHVRDACAALVATLLGSCPRLRVLATSRARLGLTGECTRLVPPLPVPDPEQLPPLASLPRYEAVRLFVERAAAVDPGFELTRDNAEPVARICHRLDGIPLALELAAARLRVLSAEEVAQRLVASYTVLTGGSRTALPQQRTLRAAMDWSHGLLDEPERTLLRRLAVFAGGFDLAAAEAVCAGSPLQRGDVLDVLASLADKSLVLVGHGRGATRYRLLETVRQYAAEKLHDAGEQPDLRHRHTDYYRHLAERAEPGLATGQRARWLQTLTAEHDNLRAALAAAAEQPGPQLTNLTGRLTWFWWFTGSVSEGRRWLEVAVARQSADDQTAATGRVLSGAGLMAWAQGDPDTARERLDRAVLVWRAVGDPAQLAQALRFLSAVHEYLGELTTARALVEQSVALFRTTSDRFGLALTLGRLGITAISQRDFPAAERALTESVDLCRQIGDEWVLAMSLRHRGIGALRQGEPAQAQADLAEALTLLRRQSDRLLVHQCLETFAAVLAALGEHWQAAQLVGATEVHGGRLGLSVIYRDDLARAVAAITTSLGTAEFAKAQQHGRNLGLDDAVALALAPPEPAQPPQSPPAGLTDREAEVLALVASGLTNAQVAAALYLSARTVNWHLTAIYGKLGVRSRTQAARWAHEHGLAPSSPHR